MRMRNKKKNIVKHLVSTIIMLHLFFIASAQNISPKFSDVSTSVGLSPVKANKYWSPVIADLNRDGFYDLILSNHGKPRGSDPAIQIPEMYWGSSSGFTPFIHRRDRDNAIPTGGTDYHGFSAGYFGNKDDFPDLIFTIGGNNGGRGNLPVTAEFIGGKDDYILRKDSNRGDSEVDPKLLELGINGFGRGRSSFFIDMDQDGDLDLVYNSAGPKPGTVGVNISDSKIMYEWKNNKFNKKSGLGAIKNDKGGLAAMADLNHDGHIDLLYFGSSAGMTCWISQGDGFDFVKNNSFLPTAIDKVKAVAEIDYDADGDLDLYIARSGFRGGENDILLEWDQTTNKYKDVSRAAGIPRGGSHEGVSVGDFDNNGFADLFIGRSTTDDARIKDLMLMNNGDKTFDVVTNHNATIIADKEDGDQSEVFDYNKDGKLDILSGSKFGLWRLFENKTINTNGNFISVRVGRSNSSEKFAPLGAVVTVIAKKGSRRLKTVRRIGSQGQSHAQSFIDTMHFGLGEFNSIVRIIVDYGTHREVTNFGATNDTAGKTYTVGRFKATSASASGDFFQIQNRATSKVIRPQTQANGALIVQAPLLPKNQITQWELKEVANTQYFYLQNRKSGKYFRPLTNNNDSNFEQIPPSSSLRAQWKRVNSSGGYFYLENRASGKYFRPASEDDLSSSTGSNFKIIQKDAINYTGNYTQWKFVPVAGTGSLRSVNQLNGSNLKFTNTSNENNGFGIYPNPVDETLTIINVSDGDYNLEIHNLQGEIMKKFQITIINETGNLDVSYLSEGIYFININNNVSKNKAIKFIKK